MYPLNVVLIGCGDFPVGGADTLRTQVRRDLSNLLIRVKTEYVDVASAVRSLHVAKDEPILFLVYLKTLTDLTQLQRLTSTFPGQPILGLRDVGGDPQLFQGALRAGAAFAVPVPLETADFQAALEWIGRQYGFVPKKTPVIAVAGVSSGAGATTLALNLAFEAAEAFNRRCVLAEIAPRLGVLATYLDAEPRFTISDLLEDMDHLDVELVRGALTSIAPNLELLAGPQHAIQRRDCSAADLLRIIHYARPLADLILADVSCTYDDTYFETLAAADKVVLVMEQKLPSVRAMQMVRDSLHRNDVAGSKQLIVVNRYDPRVPGFGVEDLAKHMALATVPRTVANDFANVSASINQGEPLRKQAPNSPALADIGALLRPLLDLGERPAKAEEKAGAMRRLVRAFGLS